MRNSLALVVLAGIIISSSYTSLGAQARTGGVAVEQGPALTGLLKDESDAPLAFADVQACTKTMCLFGESGSDGRFRFTLPAHPASYVIKTVEDVSRAPRRAAALAPIGVSGRAVVDVGTVYVPGLPRAVPLSGALGPQTVQAGDGLELTIVRDDLVTPPGKVLMGIAARRIPLDQVPAYRLPHNETVVAVFALHPLAVTSRSRIAVRAPSSLAAGIPVRFRTIDEIDGTFSDPAPGRATGTHVVTDPSAGIARLTHLVITTIPK